MSSEMRVVVFTILMLALRFFSMPSRFREQEEIKIIREETELVSGFVKDVAMEEKELLTGVDENNHGKQDS